MDKSLNKRKITEMYLYAFFIPVFIMFVLFIAKGIYPFGSESFMRTDMYHQYVPYYSELWYKLHKGESLFYSNHIGLGTNFLSVFAYYLSSPANIFLFFVPQKYVIEFASYMVIVKTGLASLAFTYYINNKALRKSVSLSFFGMTYALSGFMAAYSWNIMWIDNIILFPLVCIAFEAMVEGKSGILYSVLLGLSIYSNYYIAIMVCIYLVIYYFVFILMFEEFNLKKVLISGLKFAFHSILAGMLASVLLVPQIYALKTTASGEFDFPKKFESYFSIIDMLVRQLPAVKTHQALEHYPNIYAGSFVLILLPLYLQNKKISLKEKICYASLLFILLLSFSINVFNYIWHGLHFPNSLPARNSFIYIFLLLYMSFRLLQNIGGIKFLYLKRSLAYALIFILLCQKLIGTEQEIHFGVYYLAILFVLLYAGILYLYKKKYNKKFIFIAALSVLGADLCVNTAITSIYTSSRKAYLENTDTISVLIESINDPFYRYKRIDSKTENDGAFLNFNSSSIFSSTAYDKVTKFYKKVGNRGSFNAYSATGQTPLIDSLLATKYYIYDREEDNPYMKLAKESDTTYIYQNPYVFPLMFIDKYNISDNWDLELSNPAEVQNDLASLLVNKEILHEVEMENSKDGPSFTTEEDGRYFAFVTDSSVKEVDVSVEDGINKSYDNLSRKYLLDLYYVKQGKTINISSEDKSNFSVKLFRFDYSVLNEIRNKLSDSDLFMKYYGAGRVEASFNAKEGGTLFISIPYDKGWKIYVDSYPVAYSYYLDAFMGISVSKGEHDIKMIYEPQGFRLGLALSISSVLILGILYAFEHTKRKRAIYSIQN